MNDQWLVWTECQRPDYPRISPQIMTRADSEEEADRRATRWACGGFCSRRHWIERAEKSGA